MPPKRLAFVTGNKGKLLEVTRALAPLGIEVEPVDVAPVEVQADSLAEVARAKAVDAARRLDAPFLVDDAGLFVNALGGFPGVYSAHALKTIGIDGILKLLEGVEDRAAAFRAVIALHAGGHAAAADPVLFAGECRGRIADAARSGGHGFGFDPIFIPQGHDATFAQLDLDVKNAISHRGRAVAALVEHLRGA